MSYFELLRLSCEPFSTSPDPKFLYLSRAHRGALFRIRIAIELKRGLSLVAGDIGTGKSTLARKLNQIYHGNPHMDFHAVLNPMHHDNDQFLRTLLTTFRISTDELLLGPMQGLHAIEKYLFQKGLKEKKTVILLIDEAQLLSHQSFEILRALLNYETNDFKLLQLVLMGQLELVPKLRQVPNFWDRISLKLRIPPLDEKETFKMIEYRLSQAEYSAIYPLFTRQAMHLIYEKSQGYPRRINILCHDSLEYLVMMDKKQVDEEVIRHVCRMEAELTEASEEPRRPSLKSEKSGDLSKMSQDPWAGYLEEDNGFMFPIAADSEQEGGRG